MSAPVQQPPSRQRDTIVQIATGADVAGVGIVRLSGPQALRIGRALVGLAAAPPPRMMSLRRALLSDKAEIDEGLYVEFIAPASLTGEDVAEFQGHGGRVGLLAIMQQCVALGARAARPGEFLQRAFEHGKIDLTQAEAIAAAVSAETEQAYRLARRQASGELARAVAAIRGPLVDLAVLLNADVEFPDEELGTLDDKRVRDALAAAHVAIDRLLDGYRAGRLLSQGAVVALAGPPNAGKSSLMNALVGFDRSIVTEVAGTTRDTVEERLALSGVPVRLVDTAGLRGEHDAPSDVVEAHGIARAERAIAGADCVLAVLSKNTDWLEFVTRNPTGLMLREERFSGRVIWAFNKIDLAGVPPGWADVMGDVRMVPVSALSGTGLAELRMALAELLGATAAEPGLVSVERHATLLTEARQALERAAATVAAGLSAELTLVDVEICIHRMNTLLGENVSEEVYTEIFRRFCIGK